MLQIKNADADSGLLNARLQNKLEMHNAKTKRGYRLSLSVGIVYFDPESPISIDELLVQADRAMYEQKRKKQEA